MRFDGHASPHRSLWWVVSEAHKRGLIVTSTTGGRHAPRSFHYSGRAVDIGLPGNLVGTRRGYWKLILFQRHLHRKHGRKLTELFGPSNRANRKYGRPLRMAEGSGLEQLHDNHIHVAI